tara:strand:+ start:88 stop:273 length:186 start_codon:yes stop_codon:yes gene_type:complete
MQSKPKSRIACIRDYFERKEGQTLSDVRKELVALSDAEKLELAQGAAKELGYTQEQVNFKL